MSSAVSQLNPLFGRKWQVQIKLSGSNVLFTIPDPNADPTYDPQALKVTFDVQQVAFQHYWTAEIIIWNADATLIDPVLKEAAQGAVVTLAAGYQNGNYNTIWSGPIFQAFLERENVTDLKLRLWCVLGLPPYKSPSIGASIPAFQTQQQIVQQIAALAHVPIGVISKNLSTTTLPRSQVVFGNLDRHLDDIAESNNMQWWIDQNGLNMGSVQEDVSISPTAIVFSPPVVLGAAGPPPSTQDLGTQSIIGTPVQTMYGVSFRVLLDPRVQVKKPLTMVQINNSLITFMKSVYGENPRLLDQSGQYVVIGARFVGDTRGNAWYTEITGWTRSVSLLDGVVSNASLGYGSAGTPGTSAAQ